MNDLLKRFALPAVDRLADVLERRWRNGPGMSLSVIRQGDIDMLRAASRANTERVHDLAQKVDAVAKRQRSVLNRRVAPVSEGIEKLTEQVRELESEMTECRKLNQRLADVLDVVTEVLVPSVDRDDDRVRAVLDRLDATVDPATPRADLPGSGPD